MTQLPSNKQRFDSIDIIRGIAVFGIFVVNFADYINPMYIYPFYTGAEAVIRLIFNLFFQTKFYTIFSFLFGVSFYLFMNNAEKKGHSPYRLFSKRLCWLFFFGVIHFILLWYGDILHNYALIGFLLLFFYHRKPQTILFWSLTLSGLGVFIQYLMALPPVAPDLTSLTYYNALLSWSILWPQRAIVFVTSSLINTVILTPELLGLFLLGLYCGKIDFFRRTYELLPRIRLAQKTTLILGILFSIPIILQFDLNGYSRLHSTFWVGLSGKALSIFYVTTILIFLETKALGKYLSPFKYVGRTAFSNYIGQTIICTLILPAFISNTLAISLLEGFGYTVLIFILQLLISKCWLVLSPYGPLEWIWRKLTYGKQR